MARLIRRLLFSIWYIAVAIIVLLAVSMSVARFMLPYAEQYKQDLETAVTKFVGQKAELGALSVEWEGFRPQFVFVDVEVFSKKTARPIINFSKVKLGFDVFASALERKVVIATINVEGADLVVQRSIDGNYTLAGVSSSGGSTDTTAFSDWLMNQEQLKISKSKLVFIDQINKRRLRFEDLNVKIANNDDEHFFSGSVSLPAELGKTVAFAMSLNGNFLAADAWDGEIYFNTRDIKLAKVLEDQKLPQSVLENGRLTSQVWSTWKAGKLVGARGEAALQDLRIRASSSARIYAAQDVRAIFGLKRDDSGWNLLLDDFVLSRLGKSWPKTQISMQYFSQTENLLFKSAYVDLTDMAQLGLVTLTDDKAVTRLSDARPSGFVRDLFLSVNLKNPGQAYAAEALLQGVSMRPIEKMPGVSNLSGRLQLNHRGGKFLLDSTNWQFEYPELFSRTLAFNKLNALLQWRVREDMFSLDVDRLALSSADLNITGRAAMLLPQGKSPFVDVALQINKAKLYHASAYLPRRKMKKSLVDWMDYALIDGEIQNGGMVLYGDVSQFPFEQGQGRFDLRFDVMNGELIHTVDWPVIRDIVGSFYWDGKSLGLAAESAKILGSTVQNVEVSIDKLAEPVVDIKGNARGPGQDVMAYIHGSGLEQLFGKNLQGYELGGSYKLELLLSVPLIQSRQLVVSGSTRLENNTLLLREQGLSFENISGDFHFDERGIYAPELHASLDNLDYKVNISSSDVDFGRAIFLSTTNALNNEQMFYFIDKYTGNSHWRKHLKGGGNWSVQLVLPTMLKEGFAVKSTLSVKSDLQGIEVSLPYPLQKAAEDKKEFKLDYELNGPEYHLSLRYGEVDALLEFVSASGAVVLQKGGFAFNAPVALPAEQGFRYMGTLRNFSWKQWSPLLFPEDEEQALLKGGSRQFNHYFDVLVADFEFQGANFSNLSMQASNSSQGWSFHLSGPDAAGDIYMPVVWKSAPVVADLQHLKIHHTSDDSKKVVLDPRDLPEFKVNIADFVYNERAFGSMELMAASMPQGLRLDRLVLASKGNRIVASGDWSVINRKQKSSFNIHYESDNLGKAMTRWAYESALAEGVSSIDIVASWPDTPVDFALEKLTGLVKLNIDNARVLDVNPGAGRVFGLLSFSTLPRRIFLDFKDVFGKGMAFDQIKGNFDIENGEAFTSGLVLDGPAANIEIAGRIGLASRDYDQVITVIPKLGDSIPLLGVLAVAPALAPQVGATLYVVQKLLKKQIDELTTVQYTVEGSWDDPKIVKVDRPTEGVDEDLLE